MPHMYILECADGSYYTGSTWNLKHRLQQHQDGLGANHTAKRLPVKLVYCEYFDRVEDAFHREKQVQGWSRRKKQALIEGNRDKLIEYSRNYTQHPPSASASGASSPSAELVEAKPDLDELGRVVEASGASSPSAELVEAELGRVIEGSDFDLKEMGYGG